MSATLTNTDLAVLGLPPRKPECFTCPRAAKWVVVSHWPIEDGSVKPKKRFACYHHVERALRLLIEFGPDVKVMKAEAAADA